MAKATTERKTSGRPSSAASRDKLLKATEYLILHEGPQAVTLRRVADLAKVNLSLVGYHFGGLNELIAEVMQINSDKFLSYERELLERLIEETEAPKLVDLVLTFLLPLRLPSVFHPDKTAAMAVYEIFRSSDSDLRRHAAEELKGNTPPLLEHLRPLLPHLDDHTIILRLNALSTGMTCLTPRTPSWEIYHLTTGERPETDIGNFDDILSCAVTMMEAPRADDDLKASRKHAQNLAQSDKA